MSPLLVDIARSYVRRSPLREGKWRVSRYISRYIKEHPVRGTVPVCDGLVMALDTSDFVQSQIYAHCDFEPHVRCEIRKFLKPGDLFIDVGANVGFFTLIASRIVGNTGRVVAFEPVPDTQAALRNNLAVNSISNVTVSSFALSDGNGRAKLFLDAQHNSGAASLRPSPNSGATIEVELATFDDFARSNRLGAPALVKIDAEGAELKVLRGMEQTLREHAPPVVAEISEGSLKQLGCSKDALFAFMAELGYGSRLLSEPRPSVFFPDDIYLQYDALFVHKTRPS